MDERTDLVKRKNSLQDPEFFVDEAENGHPPPSTVGVQSPGRTRATVAGGRGTAGRLRVGCRTAAELLPSSGRSLPELLK